MRLSTLLYPAAFLALSMFARADTPGSLVVDVNKPGIHISPLLYGLMTEEINHSYDGGIYAELIQNRTFSDTPRALSHWSSVEGGGKGSLRTSDDHPAGTAITSSATLTVDSLPPDSRYGIANDGFWGIPVTPKTRYRSSFYAKASAGYQGGVSVAIETADGARVWASATVPEITGEWKKYTIVLSTSDAPRSTTNRYVIYSHSKGDLQLTQISLFPPTFNNRTNGNRIDLMQTLGAMKPAFLRLPGGNYLEGDTFKDRFAWKNTIHDISQRAGHQCPWGYRSSDGLGLLEYLEWCEDLKMEPILAVFAGYVLRGEHVDAGPALKQYVDEALDEIEYLTGGRNTKWGAERAKDGHPAPFKLHYVEVGNEDWFDRSGSYEARFAQFFKAIKQRYPELQVIATGPVKLVTPDVIDDHYYRSAADMERDVHHYDNYPRTGPKIFVGEWASTEGSPTPTLKAALGDAAWLIGMERNSDLIPISCYAPLLVNVNRGARQWGTNLIGYDALNSFGSPSYYVQALFGNNRGDQALPVQIKPQIISKPESAPLPHGAIGLGTWSTQAEFKDITVTHEGQALYTSDFLNGAAGWKNGQGNWKTAEGAFRQSLNEVDCRATVGDAHWSDYTYSLKARKISGAEGFLIMFHVQDSDNFLWWNIGGWGNSRSVIERERDGAKAELGAASSVTVETGRWYDIKVEVAGRRIRCYLDGKLITETTDRAGNTSVDPIYSTASTDDHSGDVIVKVVNVSRDPQKLQVTLSGATNLTGSATITVIKGQPGDINSVDDPHHVSPTTTQISGVRENFEHDFAPYSVTVLRIHRSK